ncbi:MAG: choice-of-anchor D domain-containing protein [Ignavibacteriae bacterium]|nr:choice-of-anchor D domain-containing protein [Ignavibacteriota bacterium]NOG97647.1 choice-of-anchor D domain-containing protein [Ignavibacteriota bacterium]
MKKLLLILIAAAGSITLTAQSLVDVFPVPNYSYGLTHDGTNLWVGTSSGGLIHKIDDSGNVISSFSAATDETRGLGWDGTDLWGYNYIFGSASGKEDLMVKYNSSGITLDTLLSPYEDYIGGMTYADGYLYITVYYTGSGNDTYIIKIDPTTNAFVDSIVTPGLQPQGLAYDGSSLYLAMDDNDGDPEKIWEIDPANGDTIRSFAIPPYNSSTTARPRDLAFHDGYLYLVVGNSTDKAIYKFDISGAGTPEISVSHNQVFFPTTTVGTNSNFNISINNTGSAQLIIDSLRFNDNVYSTTAVQPINIDPGNFESVSLNFSPASFAYYTGILTIYSNDPINPEVTVNLNGQGVLNGPAIALSTYSYDFGEVWVASDGVAKFDLEIANQGNVDLDISDMNLSLPEYAFESVLFPYSIAANDTLTIEVRFTPSGAGLFADTLKIYSNDPANSIEKLALEGTGFNGDYSYGYMFWNYTIPDNPATGFQDKTLEALRPINDITGDGVSEIIVASENYYILCLDGAASSSNDYLWSFNMHKGSSNAGSIGINFEYGVQDALAIAPDLNNDGYEDVVIAVGGGNEHVYALDGTNGNIIWSFGDDINFDKGDFEAVDVKRDFNNDGINDVLAIADGNDTGSGYKRAYLFDGTNGDMIWNYSYPGPNPSFGKTIISIDDINGDDKPDAVIAVGNNGTANLKVYALNGINGTPIWNFPLTTYEPKELLELPVPGDTPDVIAAGYFGELYRLDGETGTEIWNYNLGGLSAVIQMDLLKDINSDGIDEIVVASFGGGLTCIDGADGSLKWLYPMANQYGVYSVPDLNNDGYDDVITGDQNGKFYAINGDGQTVLFSYTFAGDPISAVGYVPSIDGNLSYELLAGTRNGKVACFSGGVKAVPVELTSFTAQVDKNTVLLKWETATENNNQGFYVERKTNEEWNSAGFIEGAGTSAEPNNYYFSEELSDMLNDEKIFYRLKQVDYSGSFEYSDIIEVVFNPTEFSLSQNYPNPFNPSTKIYFVIPNSVKSNTKLVVFDILGNQVTTLINEKLEPGYYEVEFSTNSIDQQLSSGVYFYQLSAGTFVETKKLMLLK